MDKKEAQRRAKAKEILDKAKQISLEDIEDPRMDDLPNGVPFARIKSGVQYDLLKTMASGIHSRYIINYGGFDFPVRLLSVKELMEVELKARQMVFNDQGFIKEHEGYVREALRLEKALTSCPEASDGVLKLNDLLSLDLNFFLGLVLEYQYFVEKCDLSIDNLTIEDYESIIADIKKKEIPLRDVSPRKLAVIVGILLERLAILTTPVDNSPLVT